MNSNENIADVAEKLAAQMVERIKAISELEVALEARRAALLSIELAARAKRDDCETDSA